MATRRAKMSSIAPFDYRSIITMSGHIVFAWIVSGKTKAGEIAKVRHGLSLSLIRRQQHSPRQSQILVLTVF